VAAPKVEFMMAEVDGRLSPLSEAHMPLTDHGFLFGDSVYETLRTYGGRLFCLPDHLVRLRRSAAGLEIPIPWDDGQLNDRIEAFRQHLAGHEHYLRLIITRGSGEIHYRLDQRQQPRLILMGGPFEPVSSTVLTDGLTAVVVSVARTDSGGLHPGLKTGNLLNARLATLEAHKKGAQEALLLNSRGELTEATTSNLFLVLPGEVLATPSSDSGILEGITRGVHLKLARQLGLTVREERLPAAVLEQAEEAFLSGSSRPIAPLREINGRKLQPIPGPITSRLLEAFRDHAGGL
jgi:branched-chain amino acid aminotransferase